MVGLATPALLRVIGANPDRAKLVGVGPEAELPPGRDAVAQRKGERRGRLRRHNIGVVLAQVVARLDVGDRVEHGLKAVVALLGGVRQE